MSNRRNVAPVARWLLAALALAALAARATAAPKKVTVYSCQDVDDAFRVLGGMAANATTSSPISLTITYACNGTFFNCFGATLAFTPPSLRKQPKLTLIMEAGRECKAANARPQIASPAPTTVLFTIASANISAAPMDVIVRDLAFEGIAFFLDLPANQTTSVTLQRAAFTANRNALFDYPVHVRTATRVTITDCSFENMTDFAPVFLQSNSGTIMRNTFKNTNAGFIRIIPPVPKAKFTVSGNSFANDSSTIEGGMHFDTTLSARSQFVVTSNKIDSGSMTDPVICVRTNGGINSTTLTARGNKGLVETKPWRPTSYCNIYALNGTS